MFRSVVALVVAGALAASANAQSPMLKLAKVEKNALVMNETVTVIETRTVQEEVKTATGKVEVVTKAVAVPVQKQVKHAIPLTGVKATTADGKAIPNDKLAEMLRTEKVVVVIYGPSPDADKFRKALKDDTIVLTIEGPIAVPAVSPGPAPAVIPGPGPVPMPKGLPPVTLPAKPI